MGCLLGEGLRVARRSSHHHRQRAFPSARDHVPTRPPWFGGCRYPRDRLQLHHALRLGYPKGSLRQHRPLRWLHHVPRYRRSYAEGDHQHGSFHHEDQDHRSSREEILRLDRWLHLGFSLHLPGNVDLQAGVRRGWPRHRPPQVLLSHSLIPRQNIYVLVVYFFLSNLLFPSFEGKSIYAFKISQERFVPLKMPMLFLLYLFYIFSE